MVQPYNYAIQAPSAFESLVSGLKLGTSLQEMQAQREQRALQAQAMQQKMEAERQRQEVLRDFYGKAKAEQPLTVADWLRFGEASGSAEYQKLASAQIQAMPEAQQQANAGFMGQTIAALYKSPEIGLQSLRDRVAANPQDKGLQAILQTAETNPKAAAVSMYGMMSGLGGKFADVAKNVAETLGMKEASPESFKTLDAAAVEKQFGIQNVPPGLYRLNNQTQKLESIGGGGTTVNIKNEGPIAQDYRRVRDAQGNILYDEPIPGTKAAREAEQAIKASEARSAGQVRTASVVTENIDSLIGALDKEDRATGADKLNPSVRITGIPGKAFEGLPGGARTTAKGYIDTIKANIGFDRLDQMRQESPTGGALGQIAVQEINFLQASLGSLDLDADPAVLKKNLQRIKTAYDNVMRKAAAYPNAAKYGFGTGAEPVAGGAAAAPAAAPTPSGAGQRPPLESIFSR